MFLKVLPTGEEIQHLESQMAEQTAELQRVGKTDCSLSMNN